MASICATQPARIVAPWYSILWLIRKMTTGAPIRKIKRRPSADQSVCLPNLPSIESCPRCQDIAVIFHEGSNRIREVFDPEQVSGRRVGRDGAPGVYRVAPRPILP